MKLRLAHSQQIVPGIALGKLPDDNRTYSVSEETILEITYSVQALAYLFLGASLRLCKGFFDSYADLHIFFAQSPGECIGSAEAWNVDVGLGHDEMLKLICEDR